MIVLFQLSGSIACFKACSVVSALTQAGHDVRCAASRSALEFVGRATLEGLSANLVATDTFEEGRWMEHIELPRQADLTILCPATANRLNAMAAGSGADLLGTMFLAHDFTKPFLVAPAMNTRMWQHPVTQRSVVSLRSMGLSFIEPEGGMLACGEVGAGRLAEPSTIVDEVLRVLGEQRS